MDMEAVSVNGKIFPPELASISVVDKGFLFGHGVFETFRVSDGNVFLFDEHLARLEKNLEAFGINWRFDKNKHAGWIKSLTDKIPMDKDGRVRFCVTSGAGQEEPNIVIYLSLMDKFKPAEKTARILQSINRHKPEYIAQTGFRIKSLEYSYIFMARNELRDTADDGILLSPTGYIAEALTSNVFWVKEDKIYTPPLELGILAGTVRDWLIKTIKVEEKLAKQDELLSADEIFLSAGASYITAINKINDTKKPGVNGAVYKRIYEIFNRELLSSQTKL